MCRSKRKFCNVYSVKCYQHKPFVVLYLLFGKLAKFLEAIYVAAIFIVHVRFGRVIACGDVW